MPSAKDIEIALRSSLPAELQGYAVTLVQLLPYGSSFAQGANTQSSRLVLGQPLAPLFWHLAGRSLLVGAAHMTFGQGTYAGQITLVENDYHTTIWVVDTEILRVRLRETLSSEELQEFCFDNFKEVAAEFGTGMATGIKIQILLEYCVRHNVLPRLELALRRVRPSLFGGEEQQVVIIVPDLHSGAVQDSLPFVQAYLREIINRWKRWRNRYAPLTIQVSASLSAGPQGTIIENSVSNEYSSLRSLLNSYDHVLLIGRPGGGKTTALERLAIELAEEALRQTTGHIPIFVDLKTVKPSDSADQWLYQALAGATDRVTDQEFVVQESRNLASLVNHLRDEGRLVVLWDGLNEVRESDYARIARGLDEFRRKAWFKST